MRHWLPSPFGMPESLPTIASIFGTPANRVEAVAWTTRKQLTASPRRPLRRRSSRNPGQRIRRNPAVRDGPFEFPPVIHARRGRSRGEDTRPGLETRPVLRLAPLYERPAAHRNRRTLSRATTREALESAAARAEKTLRSRGPPCRPLP